MEVSTPYVDLVMENPPARSPGYQDRIKLGLPIRFYYSKIVWVDKNKTDERGQAWYRINERYGSYGDILWGTSSFTRSSRRSPSSTSTRPRHFGDLLKAWILAIERLEFLKLKSLLP